MKYKQIQSMLSEIKGFHNPNIRLEQYCTPPDLLSDILIEIDFEGKTVLDLGTGTGMLSYNLGIDVDINALKIAKENFDNLLQTSPDLVLADIKSLNIFRSGFFDIVLMNPPFGTKHNEGIDMKFLQQAIKIGRVVYSLHKSSTRKYVIKKCKEWKCEIEIIAELKYELANTYKYHKLNSKFIDVDLIKIDVCD